MNRQNLNRFLAKYPRLGIIGKYWGDEGKGKIVDLCGERYDIFARFGGGANAGHSVGVGGTRFAFHLLPSGYARGQTCVLGPGVLCNFEALLNEIKENRLKLSRKEPEVLVDERCPLWTPYHALFETYTEKLRGGNSIGTTGRAMGPLKGFYDMRMGLLVAHLSHEKQLLSGLQTLHKILKPCFDQMKEDIPSPYLVVQHLERLFRESIILNLAVTDTRAYLFEQITKHGKRVLFEGSQATGLSSDAGTWPYVTSTSSVAGGIPSGMLLPPHAVSGVLLVMKLFPTRVGKGPMPGELSTREGIQQFVNNHQVLFKDEEARRAFLAERLQSCNTDRSSNKDLGEYIMVKAREIGVSTGRGRSPGCPDLAWARYAVQVNDPVGVVLNCLDIASGLHKIPVVTKYRYLKKILPPGRVPTLDIENVEPIIENWSGWEKDITGTTSMRQLPNAARNFIERFEEELGCPIVLVGTGPRRRDVIFRQPADKFSTFF